MAFISSFFYTRVHRHTTHIWTKASGRSRPCFGFQWHILGPAAHDLTCDCKRELFAESTVAVRWHCISSEGEEMEHGRRGRMRERKKGEEGQEGLTNTDCDMLEWGWHVKISGWLECRGAAWLRMHIEQVGINLAGAIMQHSLISETRNLFGGDSWTEQLLSDNWDVDVE